MSLLTNKEYHEIIGSKDSDFYGVFATRYQQGDAIAIRDGNFTDEMEPFPRPDGSKQFNYVKKVAIADRGGSVVGTQGFFVDSSANSNRLPDAELLSASASHAKLVLHDLANIIDVISLSAQVAMDFSDKHWTSADESKKARVLSECGVIMTTSAAIKDRLKIMSRLRKQLIREETIDFVKLVRGEINTLRTSLSPYDVVDVYEPETCLIKGDPIHLRDAIQNMIINAKEAIERMKGSQKRSRYVFNLSVKRDLAGRKALLVVVNSAVIMPDVIESLKSGNSLTQKPDAYSHGFGLACIRECARLHNGKFSITVSDANEDCIKTCFELPLHL